ncbi:MAG: HlyD family secretion protein [Bacillota bacterium]|jgi:HlyD family secretion protein
MVRFIAGFFLLSSLLLGTGCMSQPVSSLQASGTIEANEVFVGAEVGGKVASFLVSEGDVVKEGQEIARIDDTMLRWQVAQAEAAAEAAEARLGETKKGSRIEEIRRSESTAAQMAAVKEGARASLEAAQDEYERIKNLLDQGAATEEQCDSAKARLAAAQSQYDAADYQHQAALEQVKLIKAGATKETVSAAEATFNQAVAAWEALKVQLEKTKITAPIEGIVTEKTVEAGETINMGSTVAVVTNLRDLWVEVFIAEADLGKIKLGDQALIKVDAFPEEGFPGEVVYISHEAEFTPKNVQTKEERTNMVFKVKIAVDNEEGRLKPGMPADVSFKD